MAALSKLLPPAILLAQALLSENVRAFLEPISAITVTKFALNLVTNRFPVAHFVASPPASQFARFGSCPRRARAARVLR